MKYIIIAVTFFLSTKSFSQENQKNIGSDSIKVLKEVTVSPIKQSPERQPETKENIIYSGKKK